ncbi:Protein MIZU-KUSSEI [Heracleum sosnowskyi]|uniref:Protein MIZU-KUSSEI n=1 Tax=Heracleum sosnowskyi TaxID=360622 RepID=A0AAD8HTG6_9APIA|nr:Protein MIZU-KUSSEI [Heracleum sosnowskyi]
MAKSSQHLSSKRLFHWTKKVSNEGEETPSTFKSCCNISEGQKLKGTLQAQDADSRISLSLTRKKLQSIAVSRVHSVITAFAKNRAHLQQGLGPQVVGTLFGYRRGHVHFVFQKEPNSTPAFLVELATPITGLVREMASGLVRIALECSKGEEEEKRTCRLVEEPTWRTFCNGKKSGVASRKECGPEEWKILKALGPISMGAGVLPAGNEGEGGGDEIIYMRAKFERVVGSRDSEAFYMRNPDSNGAPELSLYLLRV